MPGRYPRIGGCHGCGPLGVIPGSSGSMLQLLTVRFGRDRFDFYVYLYLH